MFCEQSAIILDSRLAAETKPESVEREFCSISIANLRLNSKYTKDCLISAINFSLYFVNKFCYISANVFPTILYMPDPIKSIIFLPTKFVIESVFNRLDSKTIVNKNISQVTSAMLFASPLDLTAARKVAKLTLLEQFNISKIDAHIQPYDEICPPLMILTGPSALQKMALALHIAQTFPDKVIFTINK